MENVFKKRPRYRGWGWQVTLCTVMVWAVWAGRGGPVKSNPRGGTVVLTLSMDYWELATGVRRPQKEKNLNSKRKKKWPAGYAVKKRQKRKRKKAVAVMLASVAPACTLRRTCSSVLPRPWFRGSNWQRRPTRSKESQHTAQTKKNISF